MCSRLGFCQQYRYKTQAHFPFDFASGAPHKCRLPLCCKRTKQSQASLCEEPDPQGRALDALSVIHFINCGCLGRLNPPIKSLHVPPFRLQACSLCRLFISAPMLLGPSVIAFRQQSILGISRRSSKLSVVCNNPILLDNGTQLNKVFNSKEEFLLGAKQLGGNASVSPNIKPWTMGHGQWPTDHRPWTMDIKT